MKQSAHINNRYILYDDHYLSEQQCWSLLDANVSVLANQQRGQAVFLEYSDYYFVAKHYQRGGLVRHFNKDRYFACHANKSRAFEEWSLLTKLCAMDLPVPNPIVAHVTFEGCFYRAELLTERINAKPLSQHLLDNELNIEAWRCLGKTIKRFHKHAVYHDDLNTSNILVSDKMCFSLIDFDKGKLKTGHAWKLDNLSRLRRSFLKQKAKNPKFNFENDSWDQLIAGYSGA